MGFKEYFIEKRIRKHLDNDTPPASISRIRRIAVFLEQDSPFEEKHLKFLSKKFGIDVFDFDFFIFKNDKTAYHRFKGFDVTPSMFNWTGKITNPRLQQILDTHTYDLLIDYSNPGNLIKKLLLTHLKASFKTGFPDNEKAFYDLLISVPRDDLSLFNDEMVHYLKIIGLIPGHHETN